MNQSRLNENIAYAAYSKSENIRIESSSGGMFTEFSNFVLEHGGVVFGAAYADDFSIEHIVIMEKSELTKLRGAKYAKSRLGNSYNQVKSFLGLGKLVLFSGTPCQVFGLKHYLKKDYDNLICVDFVCHGAPEEYAWNSYVTYRARVDNNGILPKYINMRSKETGWSRYNYSIVFQYDNGIKYSALSGDDLYMRLFVGNYISMKACSNCKFKGYDRVSDITLGDFWGIWNVAPNMDDNKGISLVITHSKKGEELLTQIREKTVLQGVTLEEASKENPSLIISSPEAINRSEVLDKIKEGRFDEIEKMVFGNPQNPLIFIKRCLRKIGIL